MRLVRSLRRRLNHFWRLYIRKDPFLVAVTKWFADNGDATLRLDYPLSSDSVVFDVGGYQGDFAEAVYSRFGCRIFLFEPVPEFYAHCVRRFSGNPAVTCLNYGLAARSGSFPIQLSDDASSFKRSVTNGPVCNAEVRGVADAVTALGVKKIDLMKINIEGGEFELLPALVDSGVIEQTRFVQVQFHDFIDGAGPARDAIRRSLARTHHEQWCYPFVWESWERN